MISFNLPERALISKKFAVFFLLFIIYALIRVVGLVSVKGLEDHDSDMLLARIGEIASFSFSEFIKSTPDATPFYPFFGALFSWFPGSIELGARLASLFFSLLLFWGVYCVGKQLRLGYFALTLSLSLLAFSPILDRLSYAVLTEPSYVATCYIALAIFLYQPYSFKVGGAALLGFLFGLCFLNRTEGLIYLAVIPFMQIIRYYYLASNIRFLILVKWIFVYVMIFLVVISPQIIRVSSELGQVAINGRQVWTVLLKSDIGGSYEETIYGLNYSPSEINLQYAFDHPEVTKNITSELNSGNYISVIKENIYELVRSRVPQLIGVPLFLFSLLGWVLLWVGGRRKEAAMIAVFLGSSLVPPLIHNVAQRHLLVILPLVFLLSASGLEKTIKYLSGRYKWSDRRRIFYSIVVLIVSIFSVLRLQYDSRNTEYDPNLSNALADVIRVDAEKNKLNLVVSSRKTYISSILGAKFIPFPYAGATKLKEYLALNKVEYILVDSALCERYPWYGQIEENDGLDGWDLLYKENDYVNEGRILYIFKKSGQ